MSMWAYFSALNKGKGKKLHIKPFEAEYEPYKHI